MLDVLFAYFNRSWNVSPDEAALIESHVIQKKLKKGEFLLREGELARYGAFVAKGFLRSYIIDNKGKEHIIQFAPENWWISDKSGISTENRASFFIDAVEDTDVLLMDYNGHITLMEKIPGYAASFHVGMQKRGAAKDKRIVHELSSTAEEKYNDFVNTYPSIVQRVPQHMLASFLGITPETVSRIRKLQLRKK